MALQDQLVILTSLCALFCTSYIFELPINRHRVDHASSLYKVRVTGLLWQVKSLSVSGPVEVGTVSMYFGLLLASKL